MDVTGNDVNVQGQGSSPNDQNTGVKKTDSPPAQDVNAAPQQAPAPSTGDKPHEDKVPYDRFKEALERAKAAEEELEKIKTQPSSEPTPPKQPTPEDQFDWFGLGKGQQPTQQPQGQQSQVPFNINDELEKRIGEDLYTSPVKTLTPLIAEIASQIVAESKQREVRVRAIPDFNKYESQYYSIPDVLVNQVAANPETVRYLLAKHQATINPGSQLPNQQKTQQSNLVPPVNPNPSSPGNGQNPSQNWEQMKADLIEQGRQEVLKSLNQTQGTQVEGGQTFQAPSGENFELDEAGKQQMRMLGIPESEWGRVAKRINDGNYTY